MTPSRPIRRIQAALAVAVLLLGVAACTHAAPGTKSGATAQAQSSDPHALLKGPGIDFKRVSIGVKAHTLDFVGTAASALAGAKQSGEVFFGASDKGDLQLYKRDLKTDERVFVTNLKPYLETSLKSTPDGSKLVYCRFRPLKDVVEDPKVTYPESLAVPYVYDVKKQEEQRIFDFGQPDYRPWRANGLEPFISPNGESVYVLSYDMDRLVLQKQTEEWLARDAKLQKPDPKQSADDRKKEQDLVNGFVTATQTRAMLKAAGVTVDDAHPVTDAVRAAMRKINADNKLPKGALLISENGKPRIVPFEAEEQYKSYYHFIAAAGDHTLIIGAQELGGPLFADEPLYKFDLQAGKLQSLGSFTGMSKLVTLDHDEQNLLIVYDPVHKDKKEIVAQTFLRRIPLNGGPPVETPLGGDYLGLVDLDSSAQHMAAQDATDQGVYLVDITNGHRQLLSEQMEPLTALFLTGDGQQLVCLDKSGVTYRFDLNGDFSKGKDWVGAEYFAGYQSAVDAFLKQQGFTVPPGLKWYWEEHEGLGSHGATVQVSAPGALDKAALLGYDIDKKRVMSLWFPQGYIFPVAAELRGKNFDYYDAEKLARTLLDRAGWIDKATRTLYQPGPNPVYDQKSDSYVITFRSSYNLQAAANQPVYNDEATLRIGRKSGELIEMTLTTAPEIQNQPLTIQRKDLDFIARNVKDQPLPEATSMKVDSQGARLIIYPHRQQGLKGALYTGSITDRLCWEVDIVTEPEHDLTFTYVIDTETGEVLGKLSYAMMAPGATQVEK